MVMALRLIRSAGFTNWRNEFYNLLIKFSVFIRSLDKDENIVIIFVTGSCATIDRLLRPLRSSSGNFMNLFCLS